MSPPILLLLLACPGRELRLAWSAVPDELAPFVAAPATFTYEEVMRIRLSSEEKVRTLEERWGEPRVEGDRLVWDAEVTERREAGAKTLEVYRLYASAEGLGTLGAVVDGALVPYPAPRLMLPANPREGATWESTWEQEGQTVQRNCALQRFEGCADGWLSVCTTHRGGDDPGLRFRQAWCPGLGPVGYEATPLDRSSLWLGSRTVSSTRDGAALPGMGAVP